MRIKVLKSLKEIILENLTGKPGPLSVANAAARRYELEQTRDVPTQSEVRQQLGPRLANVFFESLSGEAQIWLGLTPPLKGPDEVWISPESRLQNSARIIPVPEQATEVLQAFTHEHILEIGERHAVILENRRKAEAEEAMKQKATKLEEDCKRRIAEAVDKTRLEDEEHYKEVVGTLMEHFEKCLNELVGTTKLRLRKECELRVQEERSQVAAFMLEQLQDEVDLRDLELCNDFHDTLQGELNALAGRYTDQIEKERKTAVEILRETIEKYERMLHQLKMEMQASALVDICRAVVQERCRNTQHIRSLEKAFTARLSELKETIQSLEAKNLELQSSSEGAAQRDIFWKNHIRALVKEFQNFINYALKAMPAHAEFLLSLEALISVKFPEDSYLPPEDYQKLKDEILKPPSLEEQAILTKIACEPEPEKRSCEHVFNYYRFKYNLMKDFSKPVKQPTPPELEPKKPPQTPCRTKRMKPKQKESLDKSNELYQMLMLVGEENKDYLAQTEEFLTDRMDTLLDICDKNPDIAMMMLGTSK